MLFGAVTKQALWGGLAVASTIPIMNEMREARARNQNVAWAGTKAAIRNNWQQIAVLGMTRPGVALVGLTALSMAPALASVTMDFIHTRNTTLRTAALPFSSSFSHSDATMQHQMRGLQSISGSRSLIGMEAAIMNQKYMRK